jgi:hypothetical protein
VIEDADDGRGRHRFGEPKIDRGSCAPGRARWSAAHRRTQDSARQRKVEVVTGSGRRSPNVLEVMGSSARSASASSSASSPQARGRAPARLPGPAHHGLSDAPSCRSLPAGCSSSVAASSA